MLQSSSLRLARNGRRVLTLRDDLLDPSRAVCTCEELHDDQLHHHTKVNRVTEHTQSLLACLQGLLSFMGPVPGPLRAFGGILVHLTTGAGKKTACHANSKIKTVQPYSPFCREQGAVHRPAQDDKVPHTRNSNSCASLRSLLSQQNARRPHGCKGGSYQLAKPSANEGETASCAPQLQGCQRRLRGRTATHSHTQPHHARKHRPGLVHELIPGRTPANSVNGRLTRSTCELTCMSHELLQLARTHCTGPHTPYSCSARVMLAVATAIRQLLIW